MSDRVGNALPKIAGGGVSGSGGKEAPRRCYRYTEACKSLPFPPHTAVMLFRADSGVPASIPASFLLHSLKEIPTCGLICYGDIKTGGCVSFLLLLTRQNQKRTMNCGQCPVCCAQRKTLLNHEK